MTCQLPSDCLNEIFEYLEADKLTLHSCLLVNRLWCEISVRILWKNIWNFKSSFQQHDTLRIESSIISTLFACLPDESKELLHKNKIFISTPTSKQPLFNYAAFFRALSICEINRMVDNVFKDKPLISPLSLKDRNYLVMNEMIKMFANQIYSLKKLSYRYYYNINFSFPYFPGVKDLSELYCSSNLPSSFFHQLSKVCHNIQTLSIDFQDHDASNELKEMISLQNNLKNLTLSTFDVSWANIIPALKNHSNITKLYLYGNFDNLPFSFVSLFPNLQEFIFSFLGGEDFENFRTLQYVNFSKLQTLKIPYQCPKPEYIIKFLENNGKNLKKFHISESDKAFNLSIAKFCPNLKNLSVIFNNGESDVLKTIFINCQHLESIKIWCGEGLLTEKEIFEIVANYSPNNFCELKIFNESYPGISSEDLECFFISWKNRIPKKLLTLINIKDDYTYDLDDFKENRKIIEKYENLGIIKFETIEYEEEEKGEFYYY